MDPTDVVVTEKLIEAVVKMNKVLLSHTKILMDKKETTTTTRAYTDSVLFDAYQCEQCKYSGNFEDANFCGGCGRAIANVSQD